MNKICVNYRFLPLSVFQAEDWQDGKTLSECNLYMLSHEVACDVTFLVGEQEEPVMAHSFIIDSRASKLRQLYADQKNFTSKLVILPDIRIEPFRLLLRLNRCCYDSFYFVTPNTIAKSVALWT